MSARDLFSVIVRAMGLWFVAIGIWDLVGVIYYWLAASFAADAVSQFLVTAMPEFLVGLYLAEWCKVARQPLFSGTE